MGSEGTGVAETTGVTGFVGSPVVPVPVPVLALDAKLSPVGLALNATLPEHPATISAAATSDKRLSDFTKFLVFISTTLHTLFSELLIYNTPKSN
jgi:hypothetical protein